MIKNGAAGHHVFFGPNATTEWWKTIPFLSKAAILFLAAAALLIAGYVGMNRLQSFSMKGEYEASVAWRGMPVGQQVDLSGKAAECLLNRVQSFPRPWNPLTIASAGDFFTSLETKSGYQIVAKSDLVIEFKRIGSSGLRGAGEAITFYQRDRIGVVECSGNHYVVCPTDSADELRAYAQGAKEKGR